MIARASGAGCTRHRDPVAATTDGSTVLSLREVRRIARAVAPLLVAQLAAALMGAADRTTVYSSRRGHGPPGYADDAWRALARQIGTRRGRWYVVTADALAAHEAGGHRHPIAGATPTTWDPVASLEAARARRAGRSR